MISLLKVGAICAALVVSSLAREQQHGFSADLNFPGESHYSFKWPIRKVAIIGAGSSGMIAYREFAREGFQVHIFERDHVPGGNWHYTDETPLEAPVPNAPIEIGEFVPSLPPSGVQLPYIEEYHDDNWEQTNREHRGPTPVWPSLTLNAPAQVQQITEIPWPDGTSWELTNYMMQQYLRSFASFHGINSNDNNPNVSYDTRVELVQKHIDDDGSERGWTLTMKKLTRTGENSYQAKWYTEDFDAVVVATGRFAAPYIPVIAGLIEWKKQYPDHISHSREYRYPQTYLNKTVLIIGGQTSGSEISKEINPYAAKVYQSLRPDKSTAEHPPRYIFESRIPKNTTIIPEIKAFRPPEPGSDISEARIELINGTVITGVDEIIFSTGYRFSFPFIPQYHNSSVGPSETVPLDVVQPVVTDGTHLRSLYLDLFYIEDPTLAFLSVNFGISTFQFSEYLSLALARVWAGVSELPSSTEMWRSNREIVAKRGGFGRYLQFLGSGRSLEVVRQIVAWLNIGAMKSGRRQLDGLPKGDAQVTALWALARLGRNVLPSSNGTTNSQGSAFAAASHFMNLIDTFQDVDIWELYDSVSSDYW